jgi:hypothetical protein
VAIQTDLHNHTPVRKSLGFHDHTTSRLEMEEPIHFSAVAVDVDFALAGRVVKLPNMLFRSSSCTVVLNINLTVRGRISRSHQCLNQYVKDVCSFLTDLG